MSQDLYVLGFDIGGTKIAVSLGTSSGQILGCERVPVAERGPDEVLPELLDTAKNIMSDCEIDEKRVSAAGIGCPSPIDVPNGLITTPTNMKLWKNVPIRNYISEAFQIPVYFDNDANAAGLAEWFFGAGEGRVKNMIYLTMSTGIGGGIIVNGHLVQGASFYAGEVGHMVLDINGPVCNCGQKGCYEAFCGGLAMENRMKNELRDKPDHEFVRFAGGLDNLNTKTLIEGVRKKIPYALEKWDEFVLRNAQAIGSLVNIFNPEIIVFGTIVIAAGEFFFEPLQKYLPDFGWAQPLKNCRLLPSALGHKIGEYAGISLALNGLYEKGIWKPS